MTADRIRAAADAMARELGAILPPEVAQDCANNVAQAAQAFGLHTVLTEALCTRCDHLIAGGDLDLVYARVGIAWLTHTATIDSEIHLFGMLRAHGFTETVIGRAMQVRRAA